MVYDVKALSLEQKLAIESLLGRTLRDHESIVIDSMHEPGRIVKEEPVGEERIRAASLLRSQMLLMGSRAEPIPDDEFEELLGEALAAVRQG